MWQHLFDLITFSHWWQYPLVWLGGSWAVYTVLARFSPEKCTQTKVITEANYHGPDTRIRRTLTNEECAKAGHLHYYTREGAVPIAAFWPVVLAAAIPALIILAYVMSAEKISSLGKSSVSEVYERLPTQKGD